MIVGRQLNETHSLRFAGVLDRPPTRTHQPNEKGASQSSSLSFVLLSLVWLYIEHSMVKNNIIIDFSGEGILNGLIFMVLYLERHTDARGRQSRRWVQCPGNNNNNNVVNWIRLGKWYAVVIVIATRRNNREKGLSGNVNVRPVFVLWEILDTCHERMVHPGGFLLSKHTQRQWRYSPVPVFTETLLLFLYWDVNFNRFMVIFLWLWSLIHSMDKCVIILLLNWAIDSAHWYTIITRLCPRRGYWQWLKRGIKILIIIRFWL